MAHLFISYSHQDEQYVSRLAQALEQEGFLPWVDNRIDYGTTWTGEVQRRLDECDVFLLVMTSHSFESRWVNNELSRAMRKNKPIFPLLLEGDEPWLAVESIQFLDVRGEKLPDERFYQQLVTVAERKKIASKPIPEKVTEPLPQPVPTKVPERILEPPPPGIPVEDKTREEVPVKLVPIETELLPEVIKPEKAEVKKAVSTPVVKEKRGREKPEKARRVSRPVQIFPRKWIIGVGMALGVVLLGTGAWLLREPLGLVSFPPAARTTTSTRSEVVMETAPPTTTAGTSIAIPISLENADQVEEVMQWGNGEVISKMAVTSTGDRVAVGTSRGVKILDAETLDVISTFDYGEPVTAVAFTKGGNILAIGLESDTVLVNTLAGADVYKFNPTVRVNSLAFDSYGTMLAAGLEDGSFMVWSMEDGSPVYQSEATGAAINVVVFNWADDSLATGASNGEIQVWRLPEGPLSLSVLGPPEGVVSLAFSPDGNMLAAGGAEGYIRIWSLSGGLLYEVYGITHQVKSIAFYPEGEDLVLASGTQNGKIYLWKPEESDKSVATLEGYHTLQIRSLAFTPDGSLISAGQDGKVLRWDLDTRSPIAENTDFSQAVSFITLSPDNKSLAFATLEGSIYIEDISGEKPTVVLKGPPDSYGIEFIDDGKKVITATSVGILVESEASDPVKLVDGYPVEMTSAALTPSTIKSQLG